MEKTGWVKVIPYQDHQAPVGMVVFTLTEAGVMIAQSGVPATLPTNHALIYVDESNGHNTGLAMVNPGDESSEIAVKASGAMA